MQLNDFYYVTGIFDFNNEIMYGSNPKREKYIAHNENYITIRMLDVLQNSFTPLCVVLDVSNLL
jgi:hypothetical protein